jgi:hypothetical protein
LVKISKEEFLDMSELGMLTSTKSEKNFYVANKGHKGKAKTYFVEEPSYYKYKNQK